MSARLLKGADTASAIRAEVEPRVAAFRRAHGRSPALHIVLVGDNPASQIYVRNKERAGADAGLQVTVHRLASATPASAIRALVERLNGDPECDGILVQSPLPSSIVRRDAQAVFDAVDPAKDVDGFHPYNAGLLAQGRAGLAPCTPTGIIAMLDREQIPIAGRQAVVIGRSDIVGKPTALLLLGRDATVTICHSRTRDLAATAARADLLVAALGRAGFVTPDFVKPGAVVIDVGINRLEDRAQVVELYGSGSSRVADFDRKGSVLAGDVHPAVEHTAGALTPVPGGVGPLTIAMLLQNTVTAAERRAMGQRAMGQ
jgi:methylenetetrahydrofolate dehydrogenase (NADP+)/methenyltetrahydrofolate cyclohydrolase